MCDCDGICVEVFIDLCSDVIELPIASDGVTDVVLFFDGVGVTYPVNSGLEFITLPKWSLNENSRHKAVIKSALGDVNYCLKTSIVKQST